MSKPMKTFNIILVFCVFHFASCTSGNNETKTAIFPLDEPENVTEILERILKSYDKFERPYHRVKPVEIAVRLLIMSINHVSEEDMEFRSTVDLVQQWIDPRLAYDKASNSAFLISGEKLNKIWLPDTFINNARKVAIDPTTTSAMIYSNGMVDYAYRTFVTAFSPMNFHNYPMDYQHLSIKIYSYRNNANKIQYWWDNRLKNLAKVVAFVVEKNELKKGNDSYPSGDYSYLSLLITIRRRLGYFIFQFYFPCILCAVVSWLPFWMDRYEIGDRISLGITTLLTEVFLSQYINSSMPHVSYIKAADVFILSSFVFIFLALMEHVVVYSVRRNTKNEKEKTREKTTSFKETAQAHTLSQDVTMTDDAADKSLKENKKVNEIEIMPREKEALVITETDRSFLVDKISRIVFPLSYIMFVIIYFVVYGTEYFNW